jgi:hypothetical protein
MCILPVFVLVYSIFANRRWRKIVEEDFAEAGMERSAMTDLRSIYILSGIALFSFLFAIATLDAIGFFYHGWSSRLLLSFSYIVPIILFFGISFFYFAVRISKDQERFAKYPPRLPNLLPILTGEEKAPKGFRNRINFWGDLLGSGWGLLVRQVSLLERYWLFGWSPLGWSFGNILCLLWLSLILFLYFSFALYFAGIPRRRYWGMIFFGGSMLLIDTIAFVIPLIYWAYWGVLFQMLSGYGGGELWIAYGLSFWYLLCFSLLGVGGLWVFRKGDGRLQTADGSREPATASPVD